jgi:DNA-binding CsgD family transcriptional regulator
MGENKMRAKKDISIEKQVEKLASYGLTNKEIAEALGFDDSTLKRKFENFLTKGKANLKQRLKRKQIDVALAGNVSMLIWLGKNYLGQADKLDENGDFEIVINRKTIDERSETKEEKTVGNSQ